VARPRGDDRWATARRRRAVTSFDRDCRRIITLGVATVAGVSGLVGWQGTGPPAAAAFAALALPSWFIASVTLWRARPLAAGPVASRARLGAATRLTLLRGLLVSLTAGFTLIPPVGAARWLPAVLYGTAALADRWDGAVARRLGEVTAMGAHLDGAMDALGLLSAPLVAVSWGRLPLWYLLLGAAYYLYQGAIEARRRLGLPLHPERVRRNPLTRVFAGLQMTLVAVALPPLVPLAVTTPAATLLMVPTLAFFVRDWLLITGRARLLRSEAAPPAARATGAPAVPPVAP
jgi:CDP-diacylglycerol--glycerol-3-phosphate 3-phosphatidyltransferase